MGYNIGPTSYLVDCDGTIIPIGKEIPTFDALFDTVETSNGEISRFCQPVEFSFTAKMSFMTKVKLFGFRSAFKSLFRRRK